MINLKDSYGFGYRLFDTETGEYVINNAKNRNEALFCSLLQNEIKRGKDIREGKNDYVFLKSVDQILWDYYTCLEEATKYPLNAGTLKDFITDLNKNFRIKDLKRDENFNQLAYCVLEDQHDENKRLNGYEVEKISEKYAKYDRVIFNENDIEENLL